jgi:peroxiredoxin (alkyl hydroperoxide reductase subunit C)
MSIVGRKFPDLNVNAINEMGDTFEINILNKAVEEKKKILLFWYPKDFTFVCPTELHAFQDALSKFEDRNTIILGASCDTAEVHFAWLNTPKDNGGIQGISYDLIADTNRNLASVLKILDGETTEFNHTIDSYLLKGDNVSYRASYLIDEEGIVFYEGINHMPLGRNVDEIIRIIDAYTHVQEKGEVCPANWDNGKEAMVADREGVKNYLSKN